MPMTIELDDTLRATLEMQAQATGESPEALAIRLLREHLSEPDIANTAPLQRNLAAFHRMLPELLTTHMGKAVAFLDGELVGVGDDRISLVKEVWAKCGQVPVLVREVGKPSRVIRVGAQRIAR